jgi:hypothetical protein
MASRCPHAIASTDGVCPADCCYTACDKPQHELAIGIDMLDPTVDYTAAVKETCRFCKFFIKNAPRLEHLEQDRV